MGLSFSNTTEVTENVKLTLPSRIRSIHIINLYILTIIFHRNITKQMKICFWIITFPSKGTFLLISGGLGSGHSSSTILNSTTDQPCDLAQFAKALPEFSPLWNSDNTIYHTAMLRLNYYFNYFQSLRWNVLQYVIVKYYYCTFLFLR